MDLVAEWLRSSPPYRYFLALAVLAVGFALLAGGRSAGAQEAKPPPAESAGPAPSLVRLHYHRYDGQYDGASVWTWDFRGGEQPPEGENELLPAGRDDYGIWFEIDPSLYGEDGEADEIGFLIRFNRDWNQKDGSDRVWRASMGPDVYLIGGEPEMLLAKPDTNASLRGAYLDADDKLTLRLSHANPFEKLDPSLVTIRDEAGRVYSVAELKADPGDPRSLAVSLGEFLPFQEKALTTALAGMGEAEVVPRGILLDPNLFLDPEARLGADCSPERTTFGVFNPMARKAWTVLYDGAEGSAGREEIAMKLGGAGVWHATVEGDLHGRGYMFRFEGPGLDSSLEAFDPYARCGTGRGGRALVIDLRRTDPEGFRPVKRPPMGSPNDAVIYEIHVRDFTIAPSSGVEAKGKFLGFAEGGTTLPGHPEVKTGLDHLEELGATHVQLLPIQDFDNNEDDDEYNWGYMPTHFNTPDGWYASKVRGPERVTEFKRLVRALHGRGIRVVMDVVYNHTDNTTPFDDVVPGYYYRMTPDGRFHNGSGTGNEFRSESPMGRKFIIDSCVYWAKEYGVSGFRFDLMGLIDLETLKQLREALAEVDPTIIVYGEPWTAGPGGLAAHEITYKDKIAGTGIGAFNDHFRDAVKGSTRGPHPGFVQSGNEAGRAMSGLAASLDDWARQPEEAVNYATCHDDLCLWDKIAISSGGASEAERLKMHRMALAMVLTGQGKAFIHGGSEFVRTKGGVENSYSSPDNINQIDWTLKLRHRATFEYVRGLVAIRRAHPMFRLGGREAVLKRVSFGEGSPAGLIAMQIDGEGVAGETWKRARVYYNASTRPYSVRLPEGAWNVAVKEDKASLDALETVEGSATVAPRATLLLWR